MLNQDSLAQLRGLKSKMEAEKEHAEAVVKGTQSRYGFAVLDDGREIFIPPDEMLKAFPNDRVRVCIRPTRDNKTIADIEALVQSPLAEFTGRCVRKGKAIFVEPDVPQLKRWLFIPPHARNGIKEGDYVRCAILRHPIGDGRPQAKVLAIIGDKNTAGIENLYCMARHQLPGEWGGARKKEIAQRVAECKPLETGKRRDLTDLEFISIDASRTLEIDDALYAEISDNGWTLFVAIADPTAYIDPDSDLCREVAARASTVYFHGHVVPMLPEELSQEVCALAENCDRPALVCKIAISDSGTVGEFEFMEAIIRSRAKLSYYAVDRYISGQYDELMSHATPLESLYQVFRALRENRQENGVAMEQRREYRWLLNDSKQIESIEPSEKLVSQMLVEECMVAANRCAARFLVAHKAPGPFVVHRGFRSDRLDEAQKFLAMHAPTVAQQDPTDVAGYRAIMRALSDPTQPLPLRSMVNRLLARAEPSAAAAPHMGMGLEHYTNCTSPLRKYLDFLVHLQIKSLLNHEEPRFVSDTGLSDLVAHLASVRAASRAAERWLAGNYLTRLAAAGSRSFKATICHVNSSGFNVRLLDNGLEGFVDLRKDPEKFSYDKWTASLTSTTRRFQLEQCVDVEFVAVDVEHGHISQFTPVAGCGLKPPKTERIKQAADSTPDTSPDD